MDRTIEYLRQRYTNPASARTMVSRLRKYASIIGQSFIKETRDNPESIITKLYNAGTAGGRSNFIKNMLNVAERILEANYQKTTAQQQYKALYVYILKTDKLTH